MVDHDLGVTNQDLIDAIRKYSERLSALLPKLTSSSLEWVLADMEDVVASAQVFNNDDLGNEFLFDGCGSFPHDASEVELVDLALAKP
jgi:hypothetical protein